MSRNYQSHDPLPPLVTFGPIGTKELVNNYWANEFNRSGLRINFGPSENGGPVRPHGPPFFPAMQLEARWHLVVMYGPIWFLPKKHRRLFDC